MGSIDTRNMSEIPLLDMSWYTSGTEFEKSSFCESLLQAFSHQGMIKLVNHGISEDDIKGAFKWVSTPALTSF